MGTAQPHAEDTTPGHPPWRSPRSPKSIPGLSCSAELIQVTPTHLGEPNPGQGVPSLLWGVPKLENEAGTLHSQSTRPGCLVKKKNLDEVVTSARQSRAMKRARVIQALSCSPPGSGRDSHPLPGCCCINSAATTAAAPPRTGLFPSRPRLGRGRG